MTDPWLFDHDLGRLNADVWGEPSGVESHSEGCDVQFFLGLMVQIKKNIRVRVILLTLVC